MSQSQGARVKEIQGSKIKASGSSSGSSSRSASDTQNRTQTSQSKSVKSHLAKSQESQNADTTKKSEKSEKSDRSGPGPGQVASTPIRSEEESSKRELSSPYDAADVNPQKKTKIPDISGVSSDLDNLSALSSPTGETDMDVLHSTSHEQVPTQNLPTQNFYLAESDLKKVAVIVQMAMQEQMRAMVKEIVSGVTESFHTKNNDLEEANGQLKEAVTMINQRVEELNQKVEKLEIGKDESEQYSRRNSIHISGLASVQNEDTDKLVLEIATAIKADITLSDIDRSHCVGKPGQANNRDLLIKFAKYRARDKFIRARRNLKDHDRFGRIFVNEDLIKHKSDLLYKARQLKKRNAVNQAWSWDGRIFVKNKRDERFLIASELDFEQFK